jgi:hypothetical protein
MMRFLLDPRLFNIVILVLFGATAIRWAIEKNWGQATYWLAALVLNIAVTFMMKGQ